MRRPVAKIRPSEKITGKIDFVGLDVTIGCYNKVKHGSLYAFKKFNLGCS
jgi:hypothetical protein